VVGERRAGGPDRRWHRSARTRPRSSADEAPPRLPDGPEEDQQGGDGPERDERRPEHRPATDHSQRSGSWADDRGGARKITAGRIRSIATEACRVPGVVCMVRRMVRAPTRIRSRRPRKRVADLLPTTGRVPNARRDACIRRRPGCARGSSRPAGPPTARGRRGQRGSRRDRCRRGLQGRLRLSGCALVLTLLLPRGERAEAALLLHSGIQHGVLAAVARAAEHQRGGRGAPWPRVEARADGSAPGRPYARSGRSQPSCRAPVDRGRAAQRDQPG
jgi:hypothetical protein